MKAILPVSCTQAASIAEGFDAVDDVPGSQPKQTVPLFQQTPRSNRDLKLLVTLCDERQTRDRSL